MWATRCCWQTDSKAPRTQYAETGGLIQEWQYVKKFSSSCSLLMPLGHLLLLIILSFPPCPANLLGHNPFSCKGLQPALCFPECVSSQTFSWEYDLQCNSLTPFPWLLLLPAKIAALPFVSEALSLLFHEQDDNLWNRITAVLKTYPVVFSPVNNMLHLCFPEDFSWQPAVIKKSDDSLCAWVTSTAEAQKSQRWTPEEMAGGVSQTPHNDTIRPEPFLIHFLVSE